jgi:murein DD-endopeptidase MepM/ murein hydrolase activator NlpD
MNVAAQKRRIKWALRALVCALALLVMALAGLETARPAYAFYNLPLLYWPVDDPHRQILSYPDTEWTWEHLGLNPGCTCPPYYRRERDDSREVWRDPDLPEEQDWQQASLGNPGVACYRHHQGTDIATPPLAPVYAAADGVVLRAVTRHDDKGDDGFVEVDHWREFEGVLYTWRARYVHLRNAFPVTGGTVQTGQVIGYVAYRGTNTHLHFEMESLWECTEDCTVNPWGPTSLWIDFDDDGMPDPATAALPRPARNANLVHNGGFEAGIEGWLPSEGLLWEIEGGALDIARRDGGAGWASVEQYLTYAIKADTPIEIGLRMGNTSPATKYVGVSARAVDTWIGYVGCAFVLPPGSPVGTYTVRGRTGGAWSNAILVVSVNPSDGVPGVRIDDVALRVAAGDGPFEAGCTSELPP